MNWLEGRNVDATKHCAVLSAPKEQKVQQNGELSRRGTLRSERAATGTGQETSIDHS